MCDFPQIWTCLHPDGSTTKGYKVAKNASFLMNRLIAVLTWLFNIGSTSFHKIFDNIFVTVSTGKDERCGSVGTSWDKLGNFFTRPMVQKYLQMQLDIISKRAG